MSDLTIAKTLDTSGKCCPMPMVLMNKAIKQMDAGEVLEVIATDPGTQNDVPSWCDRGGHRLVDHQEDDGVYRYYVEKA